MTNAVVSSSILAWAVFTSACLLLVVKVWHWYDTYQDWCVARDMDCASSIYIQARGEMRMAWLRLIVGFLWTFLAILVVVASRNVVTQGEGVRTVSRLFMFIMIWLEVAKVLTVRLTRIEVNRAINEEEKKGV